MEDATINRTRSEGGATVVREEAIVKVPAPWPAIQSPESALTRRPAVSVCLNQTSVNCNQTTFSCAFSAAPLLVLAEQLNCILVKADEDDHARPRKTDEKHP